MARSLPQVGPLLLTVIHQFVSPAASFAQADDNVIEEADDAFGLQIGQEQIGLYSAGQVRGFRLEDAGNFRLGNAYYVPAAFPSYVVLNGSETRVGANAMNHDLVGPSGIIAYKLADPFAEPDQSLEVGLNYFSSPAINYSARVGKEKVKLLVGTRSNPRQTYFDGGEGDFGAVGAVLGWRPDDGQEITIFADVKRWEYESDTGYLPGEDRLPPSFERGIYRGQNWASSSILDTNAGIIARSGFAEGWSAQGSYIHSRKKAFQSDFNLISEIQDDGQARLTTFLIPDSLKSSQSAELRVDKEFSNDSASHRLSGFIRWRDTQAETMDAFAISGGEISLFSEIPQTPEPEIAYGDERDDDHIRQTAIGATYAAEFGRSLDLNLGVQHVRYEKSFTPIDDAKNVTERDAFLYNGAVAIGLTRDLTVFASASRGLEELGIAPNNASNRNQVLSAAIADQQEIGVRFAPSNDLSVIVTAFNIDKANTELGEDNIFDVNGEVRHRGIEASLTGRVTENLRVVLGGVMYDATLTGENAQNLEPAGKSQSLATIGLSYSVPQVTGLSFDLGGSYFGPRQANAENSFEADDYYALNGGARYDFSIGDKDVTARVYIRNITNTFDWSVSPSGLMFYNSERAARFSLTTSW